MVSCFAIVILSVIGVLFQTNHHSMMGSVDDPENGAAAAVTVFSAVAVYAVSLSGCLWRSGRSFRRGKKREGLGRLADRWV